MGPHKKTLDPAPLKKWAEEGFHVIQFPVYVGGSDWVNEREWVDESLKQARAGFNAWQGSQEKMAIISTKSHVLFPRPIFAIASSDHTNYPSLHG